MHPPYFPPMAPPSSSFLPGQLSNALLLPVGVESNWRIRELAGSDPISHAFASGASSSSHLLLLLLIFLFPRPCVSARAILTFFLALLLPGSFLSSLLSPCGLSILTWTIPSSKRRWLLYRQHQRGSSDVLVGPSTPTRRLRFYIPTFMQRQ
ncbi:hypothetical protein GE09DRAFT_55785 [Coniochaeta sp. 2T2.1]|nr:hypothetical protein GE09DRAFT_55785 [Coniochaeta sp. 2T2.1]